MRRIGFLVNPIAGMGGAVGLKGTDGEAILRKAIELGASPVSPERARQCLTKALEYGDAREGFSDVEFLCAGGEMGGALLGALPFFSRNMKLVYEAKGHSSAQDTQDICRRFMKEGAELVLFTGGDGTARDVYSVVEDKVPILGIPAGVKMHSAVFALDPTSAAFLFTRFITGECGFRDAEIMDIDEEAFRQGRLDVKLFGFARTPYERLLMQDRKSLYESMDDELSKEEIARYLEELMDEKDTLFIVGPGTTTQKITEGLGIQKTLLGVDLVKDRELVARDVGEKDILTHLGKAGKTKIIVSVIGSQGFVLGRGNQQISKSVIKAVGKENILIVATPMKMLETPVLRVDTGEHELDLSLSGYVRVITGYHEMRMTKIEVPEGT